MELIKKYIKCDRTLSLIKQALTVGYLDPKTKQITKAKVGTPQGSVLSPLLANIVLHELDKYLNEIIIPEFYRGRRRITNPTYNTLAYLRHPRNTFASIKDKEDALKQMRSVSIMDAKYPGYRRSMYIRYADDFIYLLEGPITEARQIKEKIKTFL